MSPTPFTIDIDQTLLDDLQDRLTRTRWAPSMRTPGWDNGVDVTVLEPLVEHWAGAYSWREQEAALNSLDQVLVDVEGGALHAVHLGHPDDEAPALLLLHGWPDSFHRYTRVAPLLAERFHVVVPSLPGFGFSTVPAHDSAGSADLVAAAMADLGRVRGGPGRRARRARRHLVSRVVSRVVSSRESCRPVSGAGS